MPRIIIKQIKRVNQINLASKFDFTTCSSCTSTDLCASYRKCRQESEISGVVMQFGCDVEGNFGYGVPIGSFSNSINIVNMENKRMDSSINQPSVNRDSVIFSVTNSDTSGDYSSDSSDSSY